MFTSLRILFPFSVYNFARFKASSQESLELEPCPLGCRARKPMDCACFRPSSAFSRMVLIVFLPLYLRIFPPEEEEKEHCFCRRNGCVARAMSWLLLLLLLLSQHSNKQQAPKASQKKTPCS